MTAARRLDRTRALLDTPPPASVPGQLAIPDAALAVIEAAIDDAEQNNETGRIRARRVARELAHSGWNFTRPPRTTRRATCPICTTSQLVNHDNHLRRHGAPGHPCRGSGWTITPA